MRRPVLLLPLLIAAAVLGACGGGESDSPQARGGARISIDYPDDVTLQTVATIYGSALEKAGVKIEYVDTLPAPRDLIFDVQYKGRVPGTVAPRIQSATVTPAIRAEIAKVDRALSSEELQELHEQTDPKEDDRITPAAAALRWLSLNGF